MLPQTARTGQTKDHNLLCKKVLGSLLGGHIGDVMGAPAEGMSKRGIGNEYGEAVSVAGMGTDEHIIKHILCETIWFAAAMSMLMR